MINIFRDDNMSIFIIMDYLGNEIMIETFEKLKKGEKEVCIEVIFNTAVLKLNKRREIKTNIIFSEDSNIDVSEIILKGNDIIWKMNRDDVEYGYQRFVLSEKEGFFSPAEFIRVAIKKNKNIDYVFCERI